MSFYKDMQKQDSQQVAGAKIGWAATGAVYLVLVGMVLGISSCATKVFYTQDYRNRVDSAHIDPGKLQFYNDKEFLIRRKTTINKVETENGVVSSLEGIKVQDIRVRRGTPCRLDTVVGNFYYMRFEVGDGNVVRFYKNAFDHYQIGADKWVRGRGAITYGGDDCEIERVGNDCLLMVKNYQKFRDSKQRRRVKGIQYDYENRDTILEKAE